MAEQTGEFIPRKLNINSSASESWHSFSSNSRWLAFSSKRMRQRLTVSCISYIDNDGNFSKPFVLPQQDPEFYDNFNMTFSVPEFAKEKVPVSRFDISSAIRENSQITVEMPVTMASPGEDSKSWKLRE